MACSTPTIVLLSKNDRTTYERKHGRYTSNRVYRITDCAPEDSIGLEYGDVSADKIPGNISIEHLSAYCGSGGTGDAETVTCYAIDRQAQRVQEGGGLKWTDLTVTYVGWVMQPLWWEQQVGTVSEKIVASLDDTPKGIGPNMEGTTVHRPRVSMTIYENLTGATLMTGGRREVIHELTGAVNENNWDPAVTELNLAYPEGAWLYLGATITDSPGGAYNVLHRFEMTPEYCAAGGYLAQQNYQYRNYVEFGSTDDIGGVPTEVIKREWGELIDTKVYCIAGTDTVNQFATLGL